jgi:hypothetical protein
MRLRQCMRHSHQTQHYLSQDQGLCLYQDIETLRFLSDQSFIAVPKHYALHNPTKQWCGKCNSTGEAVLAASMVMLHAIHSPCHAAYAVCNMDPPVYSIDWQAC